MRDPREAEARLTADLQRLEQERLLVVSIDRLDDLVTDASCVADLALTLTAARHMPEELTVRVVLPGQEAVDHARIAAAEARMRRLASDASYTSWREAAAVRNMGRRQRPVGIGVSVVAAFVAYACWYLATEADTTAVAVLFWVLGGAAITVAWVFSWIVVETNWVTWREPATLASAHELLSRARLEVVAA